MLKEPGEILWVIRDDIDANPPSDCVSILRASGKDGKIELSTVIQELGSRGLNDVMVEAGAGLAGAFVEGGHVNKIAAFVAPMIIGGNDAVSAIAGKGIETLSDALTLERVSFSMIDSDILIEGYVSSSPKTYSSSTSQAK
jgi:diaminohydroxyphosphoribosylaminopyrimidine deaminase/5-amino-6-(5-phosphoribosylamino)uracil reductase